MIQPSDTAETDQSMEALQVQLKGVARAGAPALRAFAAWLADRPQELAFHSVRGLAQLADVDPNTVVRTVKAAGFPGYAAARTAAQRALRAPQSRYGMRLNALQRIAPDSLLQTLFEAASRNLDNVFSPTMRAQMERIALALVAARRVQCIGVRMSFALAHYFTYRGGIAHPNVVPTPAQPGLILDSLIDVTPDDIVMVIAFAHYSSETVRAARVARSRGARVLALTDRHDSPLAEGAWEVLCAPVEGPNVMFTIIGAMLIIECLLESMVAGDADAEGRIKAFERALLDVGAYARR